MTNTLPGDRFAKALAPTRTLLCLLGRPSMRVRGRLAPLAIRPKAVSLLTYLALTPDGVSRRDVVRLLFAEAEAPLAELFVARDSDHATLVRDPEPAMVDAILEFMRLRARPSGPASSPRARDVARRAVSSGP